MDEMVVGVGASLKAAYDKQYTDETDAWRDVGGKYKADNILHVCRGHEFERVLDCGAGDGSVLKYLEASGAFKELHAIEISDSAISQIEKRRLQSVKEIKQFDGYEIPYPDGHFQMAYCSHVVEHVEHPRALLRELARVSQHQVFEIPLDYSAGVDTQIEHYLSYGHINVYTPSLFRFLLRSEGFVVKNDLLTHVANEVRRHKDYVKTGLKKTPLRELKIALLPFLRAAKKAVYGSKRFDEYAYSAYTCLTERTGRIYVL